MLPFTEAEFMKILTLNFTTKITLKHNGHNNYTISCAGPRFWMMTRWTLPHPKPVPNTRTPKNEESLGRCNRTNTTTIGCLYLPCVLSGKDVCMFLLSVDARGVGRSNHGR